MREERFLEERCLVICHAEERRACIKIAQACEEYNSQNLEKCAARAECIRKRKKCFQFSLEMSKLTEQWNAKAK